MHKLSFCIQVDPSSEGDPRPLKWLRVDSSTSGGSRLIADVDSIDKAEIFTLSDMDNNTDNIDTSTDCYSFYCTSNGNYVIKLNSYLCAEGNLPDFFQFENDHFDPKTNLQWYELFGNDGDGIWRIDMETSYVTTINNSRDFPRFCFVVCGLV
jgi:hypothetical protein